jgi:hypothetical protein
MPLRGNASGEWATTSAPLDPDNENWAALLNDSHTVERQWPILPNLRSCPLSAQSRARNRARRLSLNRQKQDSGRHDVARKPARGRVVAALLERYGGTYCEELDIAIERSTPPALFRWLCAS